MAVSPRSIWRRSVGPCWPAGPFSSMNEKSYQRPRSDMNTGCPTSMSARRGPRLTSTISRGPSPMAAGPRKPPSFSAARALRRRLPPRRSLASTGGPTTLIATTGRSTRTASRSAGCTKTCRRAAGEPAVLGQGFFDVATLASATACGANWRRFQPSGDQEWPAIGGEICPKAGNVRSQPGMTGA